MADLAPGASYGGIIGMGSQNKTVDIFGTAAGLFTGDWLSTGLSVLSMLGGKTDVSGANGLSQGSLNTSGYVVGDGSAEGADLNSSLGMQSLNNVHWAVWAVGTLIAVAIIKKAV